jgi:hypothetical protein
MGDRASNGRIVLRNPSIGFSPKNDLFVASALFDVERAYGEARKLVRQATAAQAESLSKNSRGSSVTSPIVIDPNWGFSTQSGRLRSNVTVAPTAVILRLSTGQNFGLCSVAAGGASLRRELTKWQPQYSGGAPRSK